MRVGYHKGFWVFTETARLKTRLEGWIEIEAGWKTTPGA